MYIAILKLNSYTWRNFGITEAFSLFESMEKSWELTGNYSIEDFTDDYLPSARYPSKYNSLNGSIKFRFGI